ncbi:MAG: amidohydrolase [Gemmatimonadota bacterium]|nr:amidohydrolase [Gemmatimonadota bacterium]
MAALAGLVALAALAGCGAPDRDGATGGPADLVLRGGRIVTLAADRPETSALAARDGRIVWTGDAAEAGAWIGPETEVLDLGGRLAVPGLIEAHAHFSGLGEALFGVDLAGARTWDEVVERVAEAARALPPGTWVVGRGWHQSKWDAPPVPDVRGFPVHDALSAATPDHPVLLQHASGHAAIANARAMAAAGLGPRSASPPGGEMLRRPNGRLAGVFVETASEPVESAYAAWLATLTPERRAERTRDVLRAASREALGHGITTFHDAGASPEDIAAYRDAIREGDVGVRLHVMLSEAYATPAALDSLRVVGDLDGRLTVRAIKAYADGALGSRGAWLLDPYADEPGSTGHNVLPMERIRELADLALAYGWQLCTHAIGDRANREVLDVYEEAFAARPEAARDARFRIEHAQILHPDDVSRFARLGVVAGMQAIHAVSDAPWTPDRLGAERTRERAFVFRDLLAAGAVIANGTDAPVEPVDPIASFDAAVTGRTATGAVFQPHQRMTRDEALRSYTLAAAYAGHEEDEKGSLEPGKLADITVLDRDILTVPEDSIPGTQAWATIVGGRIAWHADRP